jgi:hypothetical protein
LPTLTQSMKKVKSLSESETLPDTFDDKE